jgi:hypothetical protein
MNASEQTSNVWEVKTEVREFAGTTYNYNYLYREDGFTLKCLKTGRTFQQTFQASGVFGEFRFIASRWDDEERKDLDYYIVHISFIEKGWSLERQESNKMIIRYAKDIESGLLVYPVSRTFEFKPVKQVFFNSNMPGQPYNYLKIEDLE